MSKAIQYLVTYYIDNKTLTTRVSTSKKAKAIRSVCSDIVHPTFRIVSAKKV